jgi:DNA-binding MarR family transcriptional regulator
MDKEDFLKNIELAGLTSRIKRLSDEILYSTKEFYKEVGADIEPNWHLVFLLLKQRESLSVTQIAEKLKLSHPAIIKIIKNMKAVGYVESKTDTLDSRKQNLKLSDTAIELLPTFEKYWDACIMTMGELIEDNPDFLESLSKIEHKIIEKSYKDRTLINLNKVL